MIPFPKSLTTGELILLIFKRYSEFDYNSYVVTREVGEKITNNSNPIQIRDLFEPTKIFFSGYTPNRREYYGFSEGFICTEIKKVFKSGFELIKKVYKNYCQTNRKIDLKNGDESTFVLELFLPKEI